MGKASEMVWRVSACYEYCGPPNNGMHPTADTVALIFGYHTGRRVMPGVRPQKVYDRC